MAESRKKSRSISLRTESKIISVELFDAARWPDHSSEEGLFRVKIDGRWYCPAGKYTFLPYSAVGSLIARLLSGLEVFDEEQAPAFKANQRVKCHHSECIDGMPVRSEIGWTVSPPYRGIDGRWYVFVLMGEDGIQAFPVHDVELVGR